MDTLEPIKPKAIVLKSDLFLQHQTEIIALIKKANQQNILVIVRSAPLEFCSQIKNIITEHHIKMAIVEKGFFSISLTQRHLEDKDCFFLTEENLDVLSKKMGIGTIPQKTVKVPDTVSIFTEMQKQKPEENLVSEKIQVIVFEDGLFVPMDNRQPAFVEIIKNANQKGIGVIIQYIIPDHFSMIKRIVDAYKLDVAIQNQFEIKDACLLVTSKTDLAELSAKIKAQPKHLVFPESESLAQNILDTTPTSMKIKPLIKLINGYLLQITLDQQCEFLSNLWPRKYLAKITDDKKIIQIHGREQIEKFVGDYACDIAKLHEDGELKYSPMPEVIHAIIFEIDSLIQYKDREPFPNPHQSWIIELIKKSQEKSIPVFVRYAKSESFEHLSDVLYTPEHQFNNENLPIMNQSDFDAEFRLTLKISEKKYPFKRDDCLYIMIPNGTLYETDTGFRTHVLLIHSNDDLNYLSSKIEKYDVKMLLLEEIRVAKNVCDDCTTSKIPSIKLLNKNLLHIICYKNEDAQKIAEKYKKQYDAELDASGKIVKIVSPKKIETFVEDYGGNIRELHKQAGIEYTNRSCTQQ